MNTRTISKARNVSHKSRNATISREKVENSLKTMLDFMGFWGSILFRDDHPLRPLFQKHLLAGTTLSFGEGIELYEQNKKWCSKR